MNSKTQNTSFPWLKSPHDEFYLLRLPKNITEVMLSNAVSFISNKCFYYDDDDGTKTYLHLPAVTVKKNKRDSIPLGKLFKEAVNDSKTKKGNVDEAVGDETMELEVDDFRFQTLPETKTKLLKSKDVKDIFSMSEKIVKDIDDRFSVGKFSVLYSKPGGAPQGFHIDDFSKTKEEQELFGEMLSAIVSIQDKTTIDVVGCDKKSRMSITIPKGFMFLFSGRFVHGGSAYECHNVRLHFYFYRSSSMADKEVKKMLLTNKISLKNVCPVPDCKEAIARTLFTSSTLQDHWYTTHRKKIGLTYLQYIGRKNGTLQTCKQCGKKLLSERAAKDHARICKPLWQTCKQCGKKLLSERAAKNHARICKPFRRSPRIVSEQSFKDFKTFKSNGKRKVGDCSTNDNDSSQKSKRAH